MNKEKLFTNKLIVTSSEYATATITFKITSMTGKVQNLNVLSIFWKRLFEINMLQIQDDIVNSLALEKVHRVCKQCTFS